MIFAWDWRHSSKTFVCRQMNVHGPHMPFTNMQLSQRCSVAALFPVCLCLLIFCFHIPGMLGLFGKVPATLSLESQIPSIVQQATWDKNQNRKIRWSLFGCRGCSCLDFRRIRIYFDQFWGKLCSQKTSLLDICLRWVTYLGLPDLPQVMPHLEWWIVIYKGCWNMIFAWDWRHSQRHLFADSPWTPHAVHKHAAFTTMFSCSIVSSLSLFAYLLLPHPWYVRPVRKGTSDIEPGIPDSFNCPTSHMRQTPKQENQVEFVWLSWMQLSWFSAN